MVGLKGNIVNVDLSLILYVNVAHSNKNNCFDWSHSRPPPTIICGPYWSGAGYGYWIC